MMKVMSGNPTGIKTLGKSQIPHTQFILVNSSAWEKVYQ